MGDSAIPKLIVFALVAFSMTLWPADSFGQEVGKSKELSPGRVRTNLGEGPANVPGFDRVWIVEDVIQPGASWKTESMPYPMFCTLHKGELARTMADGTRKLKAGDSWVCKIGEKTDNKSTGSEPAIMRMHWLLKPGEK